MNIQEALKIGREILLKEDITPREARLLLAFVLQVNIEELLSLKEISEEKYQEYYNIIKRRAEGEPFAYLVGKKEFMKLDFKVNSNVLIPRADTEVLVEEVLKIVKEKQSQNNSEKISILDMCTGSGCIAISLAKYLENTNVIAVDISKEALKIAKENALQNDVQIKFIHSNLFEKVNEKFDVIVSNPPYIPTKVIEGLQREVKKEPILALDGGETGEDFYKKIIDNSPYFLNEHGILAFEIGFDQGEKVSEYMKKNGFENVEVIKDLEERDRVVLGFLKK